VSLDVVGLAYSCGLNTTCGVCVPPAEKPLPVIVSDDPTAPEVCDRLVITGDAVTVKVSLLLETPLASGSSSGVAQIQQGSPSNSVPFTINTASVTGISPTSGLSGTQVTINGSGFGAVQGSGQVWLGTVPAVVDSWSDGQVIATVATGAASGSAEILQNGVMSNAVPFTINLPHISDITPNSGGAGTAITINGNGFGATQGSGNVWIGNMFGVVTGWSDSQIVASVGSNAVSGIVKVDQNGIWSNAVTFTVPGGFGSGTSVTLVPNVLNLLIGGTQQLQALDSYGNSVTGLTWTSSNTAVATLSTDDPPILTAVAPGNATITAGNASGDVTVFAGSALPIGTVIWSNPGDGSGVSSIVPAVPSSTGVADVFALQADGNVQAIKSDGTTAWTAQVGTSSTLIPDFQGGLVVYTGSSIYKLDGMTGIAYQPYTAVSGHGIATPVVHTDGTIFTTDTYTVGPVQDSNGDSIETQYDTVIAINPLTGQPNFQIPMDTDTYTDVIVSLDKTPLETFFQQQQRYISASSTAAQRHNLFLYPYLFPEQFTLTLEDGRKVAINRSSVKEPETKTDGRWLKPGQTAYIRIPSFFYPILEDGALNYVSQFRAAKVLVIDVRNNPGGLQPMRLLKALMDRPYRGWKESTAIHIGMLRSFERDPQAEDSKGGVPDYFKGYTDGLAALSNAQLMLGGETVSPSQPIFHGRLIILIDGGCISACEDLIEPFKDNGRATLVGETTQGSAGLPYGYDFHNGMSLKLAVKREYFPDGTEFEGVGIKPDIEVHSTIDDFKNGRDPVLDKALELAAKP
jgi:hypothetical protein